MWLKVWKEMRDFRNYLWLRPSKNYKAAIKIEKQNWEIAMKASDLIENGRPKKKKAKRSIEEALGEYLQFNGSKQFEKI